MNISHQKGAAIIVALFVTSLVAAAALAMIIHLRGDIRRTTLSTNSQQAYFVVQGSVAWAKDQLITNVKQQKPNQIIDHTPITSPVDKVNGMTITSSIQDAQGLFNINSIADEKRQPGFLQLLHVLEPSLDEKTAKDIALAITDWLNIAKLNSPYTDFYLHQKPAYQAAHQNMVSISELRLVKGMTAKLYEKLAKYIIALPDTATAINVNQASAPVLMSISPALSYASAQAIVNTRQQKPFVTLDDFSNNPIVKNNNIPRDNLTTTSDYFLLQTNVTVGTQKLVYYTLLKRSTKDTKPTVTILWQMQGTL